MHLSSSWQPWGKPFTSKRYIHPPFCESIVTMWPNSMIMFSDIAAEDPQGWATSEQFGKGWTGTIPSAGMIFTLRRDSDLLFRQRQQAIYQQYVWQHDLMPAAPVDYKTRRDGIPVHAFSKDLDAVRFHQEAFCDDARVPTAYVRVTVENSFGIPQEIELGVLARTGPEFLFTGCTEPDGYNGYAPTRAQWDAAEMIRYAPEGGCLTDGNYRLYYDAAAFTPGKETDLTAVLHLAPYEKRTFTFAFTRSGAKPQPYGAARRKALECWKTELARACYMPDNKALEPLFRNMLAQLLQMFACPVGAQHTIMRQGCLQRYHWPEAKEIVNALSHVGGYSDYLDRALAHYFGELQEKDGENRGKIFYKHVPWNSRTAAALEMLNAASRSDAAFYAKYADAAYEGFLWMERERTKSATMDGCIPGLFPPGVATDNHLATAQQWSFADASMLRGYYAFADLLQRFDDPRYAEVHAACEDYFDAMKRIFDHYAAEQADSDFLYLPRDPRNDPALEAELNKDPFHYMFHNEPLALGLAGYGTETAEKVIRTYSHGGQARNGLIYPCYRSTSGAGRTWYTSWAEHVRFQYYKRAGNRDKCRELIEGQLKYNVTSEYYQCERYDDHNAFIAPWMPNASANGRLLDMLFDYYGKAVIKE